MIRVQIVFPLLAVPVLLNAQEFGDPRAGHRLAREICAACHAVEVGESHSPDALAPAFMQIAQVPGMTTTALTVALRTSHETMPNIMLEPKELQDIATYIMLLRKKF